jgi:hypothetical protein
VVVLADQHHAAGLAPRRQDGVVVRHPQVCRLLNKHVLACLQRLQCQVKMKARRDGDDDRVNSWVLDGGSVALVAGHSTVLALHHLRPGPVAARVAAHDIRFQGPQMPAVYASDESAAQKGNTQGFRTRCQITPNAHSVYTIAIETTPLTNVTPPKEISAALSDMRVNDVHTQK